MPFFPRPRPGITPGLTLTGLGETTFRNIGPDRPIGKPRFGFRIFGVHYKVERTSMTLPGRKPVPGPLRLIEDDDTGILTGPFHTEYRYGPGVNVASCATSRVAGKHRAPYVSPEQEIHGCGFYSWAAPDDPGIQYPVNTYAGSRPMHVHAVVKLTGLLMLGSRGQLSEKLQIVALTLPAEYTYMRSAAFGLRDDEDAFDRFAPRIERRIPSHYPDAQIFGSVADMVTAWPLTPPPQIAAA